MLGYRKYLGSQFELWILKYGLVKNFLNRLLGDREVVIRKM